MPPVISDKEKEKHERDEIRHSLMDHFEKLRTDPEYRKKCHEEYEKSEAEKYYKAFLKATKCECGKQMVERASWTVGQIIFGGSCRTKALYQCPECKNVLVY